MKVTVLDTVARGGLPMKGLFEQKSEINEGERQAGI